MHEISKIVYFSRENVYDRNFKEIYKETIVNPV